MGTNINNALKTIAKGSVIAFGGAAIGHLLNFLFKMFAARHFGPEDYGWFTLGLAVVVIGANISGLGMNQSIARFIPFFKERNEQGKLAYTIFFARKLVILASLLVGLVIVICSPFLSQILHGDKEFALFLMFFSLVIPLEVMFGYSIGILRGMKDMKMMVFFNNILLWVLRLAFLGIVVMLQLGIQWLIVAYLVSYILGICFLWPYIGKNMDFSKECQNISSRSQNKVVRKELVSYSLPLIFSTVTAMFRKRFDVLLVGMFLSASQVGIYNAALPIAALMTVFLFGINRIAMPVASELYGAAGEEEMAYVYKSIAKWSLMVTLPIFFVLFFYPKYIVSCVFGDAYIEAAGALRILSVGFFINAISGSFGEFLQSFNKTMPIFIISITGTFFNLILMVILIPILGVLGAALALTSSLVWMCFLGNCFLYYHKKLLPFSKGYFKTVILGVIIFTLGYCVQIAVMDNVSSSYILSAAILMPILLAYAAILYFFAADEFDRQIARRARNKCLNLIQRVVA